MIAWLPIPAFALLAWFRTGNVDPVLTHAEVHVRVLCSLNLVLLADALLEQRVDRAVLSLLDDGLLTAPQRAAELDARRRQAHALAWFSLAWLIAIALTLVSARLGLLPRSVVRWLTSTAPGSGSSSLAVTAAWWWYIVLAQPLLLLGFGRWAFRWLQWTRQMWRLARLRPPTSAAHVDGAGGLGFLRLPIDALRVFVLALGLAIAAQWYDEIVAGLAETSIFANDVIVFVATSVLLLQLPYLAFIPTLVRTRIAGEVAYTTLMRRFLAGFERTWLTGRPEFDGDDPRGASLLGSPDFSGLADLGAGAAVIKEMRSTIPSRRDLSSVLIVAVLPFAAVGLVFGHSTAELLRKLIRSLAVV